MLHATNATPNIAQAESSPSAASAPATISVGAAGIGRPICSSSTFAKTNASPYCAIRRFICSRSLARKAPDHAPVAPGGPARARSSAGCGPARRMAIMCGTAWIPRTLAGQPAEAPAVLRRPLPVLLVDPPVLENQGAFAAHGLAAAGSEHDAGADAYPAAAAAAGNADADRRRDPSPGTRAFGNPCIDVAAVGELGAAGGRAPAQHNLVVRGAVPAVPRYGELAARGGTAGKQNDHQRCGSHRVLQGNENAPKISPRGVVLL